MKYKTVTLGCKVNHYETAAMEKLMSERGYTLADDDEIADVYIINTCAVTNLSASKSRQAIRRMIDENKDAIVAVVGCYSQVSPHEIENIEGVDIILGTMDRYKIPDMIESVLKGKNKIIAVKDVSKFREYQSMNIDTVRTMSRAYVKIQDGCSQFCSYCIIPYARGPVRSRNVDDILSEIATLASEGYREVILTGIHVASFGKDLKNTTLSDLISSVANINGIERVRLSSLEPKLITEEFIENVSVIPEFCPHFHLSLQSGSSNVLKRMNRKYSPEEYENAVSIIKKNYPEAGITTDIIVGFPGESDTEFVETLEFVKRIKFNKIHVFPFSPKEGTPAATMQGQIQNSVKKERAKILSKLEAEIRDCNYSKLCGETVEILVEDFKNGYYEGYTKSYLRVRLKNEIDLLNKLVSCKLMFHNNGMFEANLIACH